MELLADLGDLRLRTLTGADAALLVEATQAESGRTLWGPHPQSLRWELDKAKRTIAWSGWAGEPWPPSGRRRSPQPRPVKRT
jgi:hypothetical protein